jgi:bacteriorhodopsin
MSEILSNKTNNFSITNVPKDDDKKIPNTLITPVIKPLLNDKDNTAKELKPKHLVPLKITFMITYILLLTTATITIIEALRSPVPYVRHILNLETAISVIAGYFYSVFVAKFDKFEENHIAIDWQEVTKTRYIDWSITTPLMLITLCLVLGENSQPRKVIHFFTIAVILFLNYLMLFIGYLGEINILKKWTASAFGFLPFFAMFAIIFYRFVGFGAKTSTYGFFGFYFVVWSLYGIVYLFQEETKNIYTNILDLTAKCLIGLGLWAYYTKTIVL